jgi:hypothetical protein
MFWFFRNIMIGDTNVCDHSTFLHTQLEKHDYDLPILLRGRTTMYNVSAHKL